MDLNEMKVFELPIEIDFRVFFNFENVREK